MDPSIMLLSKIAFVILHIITAAGWFGMGLRLAASARLMAHGVETRVAVDATRTVHLMGMFSILTFVFALGAFFMGGGFGTYGPAYHTSLSLMLVLIGIQYFIIRPAWYRAVEGETTAAKRVAMGTGIGHLLWLVMLVLMYTKDLPTFNL